MQRGSAVGSLGVNISSLSDKKLYDGLVIPFGCFMQWGFPVVVGDVKRRACLNQDLYKTLIKIIKKKPSVLVMTQIYYWCLFNLRILLRPNLVYFSGWRFYSQIGGGLAALSMFFPLPAFSQEPVDLEAYGKECSKGVTIYCIAAGMEEQKSGNLGKALEYYKSACENHSSLPVSSIRCI